MYKLFITFLNSPPNFNINSRYSQNPTNFISDIRDLMLENLNKYKNTVDVMNFQEIFEEVIFYKEIFIKISKFSIFIILVYSNYMQKTRLHSYSKK
jgi:hypothetical protein